MDLNPSFGDLGLCTPRYLLMLTKDLGRKCPTFKWGLLHLTLKSQIDRRLEMSLTSNKWEGGWNN